MPFRCFAARRSLYCLAELSAAKGLSLRYCNPTLPNGGWGFTDNEAADLILWLAALVVRLLLDVLVLPVFFLCGPKAVKPRAAAADSCCCWGRVRRVFEIPNSSRTAPALLPASSSAAVRSGMKVLDRGLSGFADALAASSCLICHACTCQQHSLVTN